jgi:hypothetical protein
MGEMVVEAAGGELPVELSGREEITCRRRRYALVLLCCGFLWLARPWLAPLSSGPRVRLTLT